MRTFLLGLACALFLNCVPGCSRSGTSQNAASTNTAGPSFTVAEPGPSRSAPENATTRSRTGERTPPTVDRVAGPTTPPMAVAPPAPDSAAPVSPAPAAVAAESTNPLGGKRAAPAGSPANETSAEDEAAESAHERESIAASLAAMRIEPTNKSGTEPGDTIPEIEGKDLDGERFALSDYQGKVLMIDFWGDW